MQLPRVHAKEDSLSKNMTTEETKIENQPIETPAAAAPAPSGVQNGAPAAQPAGDKFHPRGGDRGRRGAPRGRGGRPGGGRKEPRVKPEFDHKLVGIRRVSRTVAGGRRFSFSATVVIGNRKGMVGVGQGKSSDTPIAIEKAIRNAKKNIVTAHLTKSMRIPHEITSKYSSARIKMMPAPGKGILAGSSVRTVLDLAGVKEVNAKILSGSKNSLNIAKATIKALGSFSNTKIK